MINRKLNPTSEIGKYWDGIGGDRWVSNITMLDKMLAPTTKILLDEISKHPSSTLLEIGCGAGDVAENVSVNNRQSTIDALDISLNILILAEKRVGKINQINFIHGDAETYKFKNYFYNLVYSRFGVMFFNNPKIAFTNIKKSMGVQGKLIFLSWNNIENNPWMYYPSQAAFSVLPQPEKQKGNSRGAFSLAEKAVIVEVLTNSGFNNVHSRKYDININLGKLDQAVHFATQLGPAATPYAEATDFKKNSAKEAIKNELSKFENNENITLPGSCWLTIAI